MTMRTLALFVALIILAPTAFMVAAPPARAVSTTETPGPLMTLVTDVLGQDTISAIKNTASYVLDITDTAAEYAQYIKMYVLDPIAFITSGNLLKSITSSILGFVAGKNGSGKPLYVQNLRGYLQNVGDVEAYSFINQFQRNSNSPFAGAITSSLRADYLQQTSAAGFFAANKSTLASVSSDPLAYVAGDWSKGGILAWFGFLQDQNNPYTLNYRAQNQLARQYNEARGAKLAQANWGQGFLSYCGTLPAAGASSESSSTNGSESTSNTSTDYGGGGGSAVSYIDGGDTGRVAGARLALLDDPQPSDTITTHFECKSFGGGVRYVSAIDSCGYTTSGSISNGSTLTGGFVTCTSGSPGNGTCEGQVDAYDPKLTGWTNSTGISSADLEKVNVAVEEAAQITAEARAGTLSSDPDVVLDEVSITTTPIGSSGSNTTSGPSGTDYSSGGDITTTLPGNISSISSVRPGDPCTKSDGTEGRIQTPGSIIKSYLSKALGSTIGKLEGVGDIAASINGIMSNIGTITSTVDAATSLFGGSGSGIAGFSGTGYTSPFEDYLNSSAYMGLTAADIGTIPPPTVVPAPGTAPDTTGSGTLAVTLTELAPGVTVAVDAGDTIQYRINVTSVIGTQTNVSITAPTPTYGTLAWQGEGTDSNSGSVAGYKGDIWWLEDTATGGSKWYMDFSITVDADAPDGSQICTTVHAKSDQVPSQDTNQLCNLVEK